MTGPRPVGTVFAVCSAARASEDEFALDEGAVVLAAGGLIAAESGATFAGAALLVEPTPGPGDLFVLKGAQARLDLLLA